MIFAVDFDGTLHFGNFPGVGEPNYKLIEKIKHLKKDGHKFVLWTCRNGEFLEPVIEFCKKYNIEPDAINDDVDEIIEKWKDNRSKKISADLYIDDCTITPEDFISLLSGFDDKPKRKNEIKYFNEEILENECDLGNIIIENKDNLLLIPTITKKQVDILHDTLVEYESSYQTILYLNDTGRPFDDFYEYFKNNKIHLDLISYDCTFVILPSCAGHLGLDSVQEVREKLTELGVCDQTTKHIITHFSHNGKLIHDELVPVAKEIGLLTAYDGFSIEI